MRLSPADQEVIGRDAERRLIAQFCDDGMPGVAAVVLTGDPGIGKTALWEWSVRRAATAGHAVLVSRAGIAEVRLPWVALTDLLAGVPAAILADLPPPQRRALQVVMLQAASGETLDERTVGTAVWTVLAAMGEASPVLIAVDDLPYVDSASAAALAFALRRLDQADRTRIVATARGEGPSRSPIDGLRSDRVMRVEIGPLSVGAVFELLAARLRVRLARPVLLRVHETAGGNPLYALELARALDRLEIVPTPGVPLPVPIGLTALVAERVRSLPPDVLDIAAGTAAAWRFTDAGVAGDALARAVAAGLVIVDDSAMFGGARVVRPVHPLLSAAAYAALSTADRRALHERLCARTDDPVEHARHAALASAAPTPEVARALDAGVLAALAAGTPDIAVDLSRLALEHTGAGMERAGRLDGLADALFRTGDTEGAMAAQREAMTLTPAGPARARRRIRLAEVMVEVVGWDAAADELEVAVVDAGEDPVVMAEALLTLAAVTDDTVRTDTHAARAVALLDQLDDPDPRILSGALAQAAGARFRAGRGLDHEGFRRAIDIETRHPGRRLSDRADASYAALLKYADDLDGSEVRLTALLAEARSSGDLSSIAYVLAHLPQIALWRGDLAQAHRFTEEYLAVAEQGSLTAHLAQARYHLGLVLAHQGHLDEAEPLLVGTRDAAISTKWDRQRASGGLGFVAISRPDPAVAAEHLDQWHSILSALHFGEPGYSRSHLDYVSALIGCGRIADAERFLLEMERQVASSGRGSASAVALTGRALVDGAQGRLAAAQAGIGLALAWYESSPLRFDRARTLLIAGRIHRRAKAKNLARDALVEAEQQFRAFGAAAWVRQVEAELARVNLRPSAPASLTETERRVAELAATGLTNREVAQQLFLAVKTVEANLARVYRKLGIRSRAELGLQMGRAASP